MVIVQVDWDRCQHYGQCVFEAPNVFRLNDRDELEFETEAGDDELEAIEAAIDVCPMRAISIVEA